jgi:DNA-binding transcriptional LysR family regulator
MSDFDWNLLRSFVAVAESGSLSAAARKIGSSQPTVGRHISELERDLGVTLFRRGLGGYEITDTGAMLLTHALMVREGVDRFSLQATGAEEGLSGTIRISASEVMATLVLPQMLAQFSIEEPGIEIELVGTNALDNLLRRDADIAIRMVTPSQEELVARKIADTPLAMCASKDYLARCGTPSNISDLLNHVIIGQDREDVMIKGFNALGANVDRHAFRFRSDNQVIMWHAILAGMGVGLAQMPLIAREPTLTTFLPELALPVLPMWLTMHKDVRNAPRIRRAADFLYAALSDFARSADATRPALSATSTRKPASTT